MRIMIFSWGQGLQTNILSLGKAWRQLRRGLDFKSLPIPDHKVIFATITHHNHLPLLSNNKGNFYAHLINPLTHFRFQYLCNKMIAQQFSSCRAFAPARSHALRSSRIVSVVSCEYAQGTKVRVTSPVKVYHVGKFKQGLELQGMEGIVQADARKGDGIELSATLPWKVQFAAPAPDGGKDVKVIAHLVSYPIYFLFSSI